MVRCGWRPRRRRAEGCGGGGCGGRGGVEGRTGRPRAAGVPGVWWRARRRGLGGHRWRRRPRCGRVESSRAFPGHPSQRADRAGGFARGHWRPRERSLSPRGGRPGPGWRPRRGRRRVWVQPMGAVHEPRWRTVRGAGCVIRFRQSHRDRRGRLERGRGPGPGHGELQLGQRDGMAGQPGIVPGGGSVRPAERPGSRAFGRHVRRGLLPVQRARRGCADGCHGDGGQRAREPVVLPRGRPERRVHHRLLREFVQRLGPVVPGDLARGRQLHGVCPVQLRLSGRVSPAGLAGARRHAGGARKQQFGRLRQRNRPQPRWRPGDGSHRGVFPAGRGHGGRLLPRGLGGRGTGPGRLMGSGDGGHGVGQHGGPRPLGRRGGQRRRDDGPSRRPDGGQWGRPYGAGRAHAATAHGGGSDQPPVPRRHARPGAAQRPGGWDDRVVLVPVVLAGFRVV